MPTTYRSILLTQPTDGQIVFMRRFTRDPPVLAAWSAAANTFTLLATVTMTVTGGTYAGSHVLAYVANYAMTGSPGWVKTVAGVDILIYPANGPAAVFYQTDNLGNYYGSTANFPSAYPHTANAFNTGGAPPWTGPTTMTSSGSPAAPLIIPAELVQAWRPQ